MPTVEDITAHLLAQEVVWVFGGSVAGLLARRRDDRLVRATTATGDRWSRLRALRQRRSLRLRDQRRPLLHRLVGDKVLPAAYATDDGAGVLYRGTQFAEAVSECDSAAAHFIDTRDGVVVETQLDTRKL